MSNEQKFVALHAVTYDHPSKGRVFVKPGESLTLSSPRTIRELKAAKAIRADDGLGDEDLPPVEDDEELDEQADDEQLDEEEEESLEDALDDLQTSPLIDTPDVDDDGLDDAPKVDEVTPPPAPAAKAAPAKKAVSKTAAKKSTSNKK